VKGRAGGHPDCGGRRGGSGSPRRDIARWNPLGRHRGHGRDGFPPPFAQRSSSGRAISLLSFLSEEARTFASERCPLPRRWRAASGAKHQLLLNQPSAWFCTHVLFYAVPSLCSVRSFTPGLFAAECPRSSPRRWSGNPSPW
jgi:hypothetical protein